MLLVYNLKDNPLTPTCQNLTLPPILTKLDRNRKKIRKNNVFEIKDEGVGIDEENQKRIFERYKRVSQKGSGGFGIGLDIVMGVCRANKIEISLKSEVKKGSTFTLVFP